MVRIGGTHLDLWAANEAEQLAELERLQALGATHVEWDYPEDADFVVPADPAGDLFCVINTGDSPSRPTAARTAGKGIPAAMGMLRSGYSGSASPSGCSMTG